MTERKGQAPLRNPYQPPYPYVYWGPCITALRSTQASARAAMCIGWIVSTRLTPPSLAVTSLVGDVFDLSAADEALHCWVQWRIQGTLGWVYVWGWGREKPVGWRGMNRADGGHWKKKKALTQKNRSDNGSLLLWTWTMSMKGSEKLLIINRQLPFIFLVVLLF